LLYLEGLLSKAQIQAFRTFTGPNAYPTHEDPGIQIPTGSLGMGPGAAVGLCFVDEYNAAHGTTPRRGLQISIIGDAEFDEGVIHESIKERASHGLTGWLDFIDYNRQSLDGNLDERLVDRIANIYHAHRLPVVILKYGSKLQTLFTKHVAGRELRRRIDALSTEDYQALLRQPGGVIRRVLTLSIDAFEAYIEERRRNVN
jgi:pyruvate dehydrogenase E1 component